MTSTPTPTFASAPGGAVALAAGEGPGTLRCTSCGIVATAGELMLVTPTDGTRPYPICRPGLSPRCFRLAGRRDQSTVALFDADAAKAWDARQGGPAHDALDANLAKATTAAVDRALHPMKGQTW